MLIVPLLQRLIAFFYPQVQVIFVIHRPLRRFHERDPTVDSPTSADLISDTPCSLESPLTNIGRICFSHCLCDAVRSTGVTASLKHLFLSARLGSSRSAGQRTACLDNLCGCRCVPSSYLPCHFSSCIVGFFMRRTLLNGSENFQGSS